MYQEDGVPFLLFPSLELSTSFLHRRHSQCPRETRRLSARLVQLLKLPHKTCLQLDQWNLQAKMVWKLFIFERGIFTILMFTNNLLSDRMTPAIKTKDIIGKGNQTPAFYVGKLLPSWTLTSGNHFRCQTFSQSGMQGLVLFYSKFHLWTIKNIYSRRMM